MIRRLLNQHSRIGKYAGVLIIYLALAPLSCKIPDTKEIYRQDKISITAGEKSFSSNCSSCHTFQNDGIGPNLAGLTNDTSKTYIKAFVQNPQKLINEGNHRSDSLQSKFKSVMPAFAHLTEDEMENILAYINTFRNVEKRITKENSLGIQNPIPEPVPLSNICLELALESQFPSSGKKELQTRITKLFSTRGNSRFYIVDLRGKLYVRRNNSIEVYLDMNRERPSFINEPGLATGFGSFAFHPEFENNGLLYTTHTEAANSKPADFHYADSIPVKLQWVLTEWKTDRPDQVPFAGKSRELFRMDMVMQLHGVQEITFNPNAKPGAADYGFLYIGVGDGGCAESGFPELLTNVDSYLGSMFRIDPQGRNSKNGKYGIPKSNPFTDDKSTLRNKEIYAYGFRNPHRITWLRSGEMLVNNIGQRQIEGLYIVMAGKNHGWPTREGRFATDLKGDVNAVYPLPENDSVNQINYPVLQYDHDEGLAITGGYEYQGTSIPDLKGKFIFGDIPTGKVFITDVEQIRNGNVTTIQQLRICIDGKETTLVNLTGSNRVDLHFGRDSMGEIYIMTKPDGKLYKIIGVKENRIN